MHLPIIKFICMIWKRNQSQTLKKSHMIVNKVEIRLPTIEIAIKRRPTVWRMSRIPATYIFEGPFPYIFEEIKTFLSTVTVGMITNSTG